MKNKRVLVTGGAGYIGSHVVEILVKKKFDVYIYDNLITGHKRLINKNAKFIKGDVKNIKKLSKVIYRYEIGTIIHLASYLNIAESEKYKKKYYQNNVGGTLNLVKACKNSKVKNFIFSSSCSVYGNVKGPVSENNKLKPKSYYAYTKVESEKIIKKYSELYKYNFCILRYFNVAGASLSGKIGEIEVSHGHLIKNLAIQYFKPIPKVFIYGKNYKTKDGTCIRDYIHVSDLAELHVKILSIINNKKKSLVINCGYGRGYSVDEIVNIFKSIKKNTKINYLQRRSGDVAQVYSDTKKMKRIFKYSFKNNNIKRILRSAIKWEKNLKRKC